MNMNKSFKLISSGLLLSTLSAFTLADIAVIANKDSGIESLTDQEVRKLYLGKSSSINDTKVTPLDQQANSDINKAFSKNVLRKSSSSLNSYWSRQMFSGKGTPPTQIDGGNAGLIKAVANNKESIAYIDADQVNDDIKVLLIIKDS